MAIDNSGGGSGAGYAAMIPQLVGAGLQLATSRPTAQERQQRRIAMGAPDPAVEALRRRLATQQLQNAMALAAGQPGVNPALALRQAQAGLAQSEAATAAQIAQEQARSVQQARGSDPLARRRDARLSGIASMLNVLGTGVAAQAAGRQAAEDDKAAAAKMAMTTAPVAAEGMQAPEGVEVQPPLDAETASAVDLVMQGYTGDPQDILDIPTYAAPAPTPSEQPGTVPVGSGETAGLGQFESRGRAGQPMAEGAPPTERQIAPTQVTPTAVVPVTTTAQPDIAGDVERQMRTGLEAIQLPSASTPSIGDEISIPDNTITPGDTSQQYMTLPATLNDGSGEQIGLLPGRGPVVMPEGRPTVERQIVDPRGMTTQGAVPVERQPQIVTPPQQTVADQVEQRMRAGFERARTPTASQTAMAGARGLAQDVDTGLSTADRDQIFRTDVLRPQGEGRGSAAGGQLGLERRQPRAVETPAQVRERRIAQTRATLPRQVADDARNQALIESLADAEDMNDPELVQMIRALLSAEGAL